MSPSQGAPLVGSLGFALLAGVAGLVALSGFSFVVASPIPGPLGFIQLSLDATSGLFLVLVGGLAFAASVAARREGFDPVRRGLFFAFLLGLVIVPLGADVFSVLFGWELMSVAPGLMLVLDRKPEAQRSGLLYLTYSQVSVFLILSGLLLWNGEGDGTFSALTASAAPTVSIVLLLLGTGIKAGVMPFHSWLPEAHGNAPSPVSALMSGALVVMPVNLVVRLLLPTGAPEPVAITTLLLGALSATLAGLHALQERNMKRALALTTVAHMGTLFALIGLGLLLPALGAAELSGFVTSAVLAYSLTHGWAKGALFLVAGEVHHITHELDLERLGGLWRGHGRLAVVGGLAGLALVGLPPFGAFASELALFGALFAALPLVHALQGVVLLGAIFLLGLGAGVGLAVVFKICGGAFLGPSRQTSPPPDRVRVNPWAPGLLVAASIVVGLFPGLLWGALPTGSPTPWTVPTPAGDLDLLWLVAGALVLCVLVALLVRTTRRPAAADPWACGLPPPTTRQSYTPQGLVMPFRILFAEILRPSSDLRIQDAPLAPFAPLRGHYEDSVPRYVEPWIHAPLIRFLSPKIERLRRLHRGPVHAYLIIALLVLVGLLFLLPVIH